MYLREFLIIASLILTTQLSNAQSRFGKPATQADIDKSFWTIFPDGEFLPDGEGNVAAGTEFVRI